VRPLPFSFCCYNAIFPFVCVSMLCDIAVAAVRFSADGNGVDSGGSGETSLVVAGNAVTCFFYSIDCASLQDFNSFCAKLLFISTVLTMLVFFHRVHKMTFSYT